MHLNIKMEMIHETEVYTFTKNRKEKILICTKIKYQNSRQYADQVWSANYKFRVFY